MLIWKVTYRKKQPISKTVACDTKAHFFQCFGNFLVTPQMSALEIWMTYTDMYLKKAGIQIVVCG